MTREVPISDLAAQLTLTVPEAARLSGCGEQAIREAINSGKLIARQPGAQKWIILRTDLDAWLRDLPVVEVDRPNKVVLIQRARR